MKPVLPQITTNSTLPAGDASGAPESLLSPPPGDDSDEEIAVTTPKMAQRKRGHSAVSESSTKRQKQ